MTEKLIAFHGKQEVKDKYVARVKAHAEADEIIKGIYWQDGKGCAVGCTIEGSEHERYEKELGIPEALAHLEDSMFENLTNGEAKRFPLEFLEAIPVGADLSKIVPQFVIWEFEDKKHGLSQIKEVAEDSEIMEVCEGVVSLYKRVLAGDEPSETEWLDMVEKADRAGAGARAWAWAGAWAWAWAWARARAWAWAGAGAEFDAQMVISKNKLLELLREAK